jgi:2'-5' RNA ligase
MAEADREWIAAIRRRYPELGHSVVPPHVTLVFPTADISREALQTHLAAQTAGWPVIPFTIRCALPVKDVSGPNTHVLLVPDEGFSSVVRLHDRLYTGPLAPILRLDIPFIPHITVGYSRDMSFCKTVADALNAQPFALAGTLPCLSLLRLENGQAETLAEFPFMHHEDTKNTKEF